MTTATVPMYRKNISQNDFCLLLKSFLNLVGGSAFIAIPIIHHNRIKCTLVYRTVMRMSATNNRFNEDTMAYEATYHDYSNVRDQDLENVVNQPLVKGSKKTRRGPRGGVATPFPVKLHQLLEEDAYPNIISWQPHGRSFILRDHQAFLEEVMTKYFKQTKLTSFQRQLNLYAFRRISSGPDKGSYYHELFLRGKDNLCSLMVRMRVKGTKIKSSSCPENEPNFYRMAPVGKSTLSCDNHSISDEGTVASQRLPPLMNSIDLVKNRSAPKVVVSDDCDSSSSESASTGAFKCFPEPPKQTYLLYASQNRIPQLVSPPMELLRAPIISDQVIPEPKPVSFEGKAFYYIDSIDHFDACAMPSEVNQARNLGTPPLTGLSVVSGELCGFERC